MQAPNAATSSSSHSTWLPGGTQVTAVEEAWGDAQANNIANNAAWWDEEQELELQQAYWEQQKHDLAVWNEQIHDEQAEQEAWYSWEEEQNLAYWHQQEEDLRLGAAESSAGRQQVFQFE